MKTVTSAHLRRTGVPWQGERATSASALGSLNACALSEAVAPGTRRTGIRILNRDALIPSVKLAQR